VRELQHSIEKAVILSDSAVLKPADFTFSASRSVQVQHEMTLEEMEIMMITDCLRKYGSNISIVSEKLGITRQTLYNKMHKYGL